jgi:hypothetical protein
VISPPNIALTATTIEIRRRFHDEHYQSSIWLNDIIVPDGPLLSADMAANTDSADEGVFIAMEAAEAEARQQLDHSIAEHRSSRRYARE